MPRLAEAPLGWATKGGTQEVVISIFGIHSNDMNSHKERNRQTQN